MAITIVPAILVKTKDEWLKKRSLILRIFQRIQLDVVDGKFADNKTLAFSQMTGLKNFCLDVHLMVRDPINWIGSCSQLKANLVVGHVEMMNNQALFLKKVKQAGIKSGLALNIETNLERLDKNILTRLDQLLLMSVSSGFSGQLFDEQVLAKIKTARKLIGKQIEIGVDGGLNENNLSQVVRAGADVLYIGSAFWQAGNIEKKLKKLKKIVG